MVTEKETSDTVKKHSTYAKGSIVEYWMIIAKEGKREVRVCRLKSRSEYRDTTYQESEVIAGSMFSSFKMTANDVLSWNQPQEDDTVPESLVAAQRRADSAQKRADDAKKRSDATERDRDKEKKGQNKEKRRADAAEKMAEKKRQRADEERKRAEELEKLLRGPYKSPPPVTHFNTPKKARCKTVISRRAR